MRTSCQALISLGLCASALLAQAPRTNADSQIANDVGILTSELMEGRAIGSVGGRRAATFIASVYAAAGIAPAVRTCMPDGACDTDYLQYFRLSADLSEKFHLSTGLLASNVAALVPGTDSTLRNQFVVVGAHFDHLGDRGLGATDEAVRTLPHFGADDNASGTAAVLAVARRIAAKPLRRSVVFMHFDGEELGMLGSAFAVHSPIVALDSVIAMLNLDMVGRLRSGSLYLNGLNSAREWPNVLKQANADRLDLSMRFANGSAGSGSDHQSFGAIGIPSIHLFTGMHAEYHSVRDVPRTLNYPGISKVVDFAERLARALGDSTRPLVRRSAARP